MRLILIYLAVLATVFPALVQHLIEKRGCFEVGGEWLLFIYPFVFWIIIKSIKEIRRS